MKGMKLPDLPSLTPNSIVKHMAEPRLIHIPRPNSCPAALSPGPTMVQSLPERTARYAVDIFAATHTSPATIFYLLFPSHAVSPQTYGSPAPHVHTSPLAPPSVRFSRLAAIGFSVREQWSVPCLYCSCAPVLNSWTTELGRS